MMDKTNPRPDDFLDRLGRARQLMQRLSVVVSVLVAVTVPAAYALSGYSALNHDLAFKAKLNAERLARYAYGRPRTWSYAVEHARALITLTAASNATVRQQVLDARGTCIIDTAPTLGQPLLWQRTDIVVHGQVVGSIGVAASLRPLLLFTGLAGGLGVLLGAITWVAMQMVPRRSLEQTLAALRTAHEDIHRHAVSLTAANRELNTQYQSIAQTTQRLEEARRAAETANRSKSAFLATMSHELRTPLTAIIGFADMMRSGVLGEIDHRQYREYVQDIHDSGQHLLAIINNMLDLAKVEAGRMEVRPQLLSIPDLLHESLSVMDSVAANAGVTLAQAPLPWLPLIRADAVKMKQVVLNLLSNAIKFTPPGGSVTASADRLGDSHVRIVVADTGIGMTAEDLAMVMEPYRQVDTPLTRDKSGTGLGLPVSKALVELHGGTLAVDSTPGQGTTVTVTLPVNGPPGHGVPRGDETS